MGSLSLLLLRIYLFIYLFNNPTLYTIAYQPYKLKIVKIKVRFFFIRPCVLYIKTIYKLKSNMAAGHVSANAPSILIHLLFTVSLIFAVLTAISLLAVQT